MEKKYNLELNGQELQTIFDALVEMPFKKVAPLVARIQAVYQAVENSTKEEEVPASE